MINGAIIGTGFVGEQHAEAINRSKQINLVAIADKNGEKAREVADKYGANCYTDVREMFEAEKLDMVDICLPTFLHEEFILLAAEHKVNVICEKPITLTLESMDRVIAATRGADVKFMVAQVVRFWPEYVAIKDMYDRGVFGDIKMVYAARMAQHPNWAEWHKNPDNSGGGLFDLHLHDVDFAYHIFGEVHSVYSIGWQSDSGCWNHVTTSLKFKNGIKMAIEGAFDMTEKFPFTMKFRIVGESASVDYDMIAGFNLEDIAGSTRATVLYRNGHDPEKVRIDTEQDAYQAEIDYFASCVIERKPVDRVPVEDSREVVRIMLAIKQSLEKGEPVYL